IETAIDRKAAALLDEARAAYALHAQRLNTQPIYDPVLTHEEQQAAALVIECVPPPTFAGCGGAGRGGGRGGRGAAGLTPGSLPQHMNAELTILLGKKKTALEIRDFLSGEFEPVPLAEVMTTLRARESAGQVRLVPTPVEAPARKKKA
ncbi:MAG: hypothetical protein ABJC89_25900, partial [Acidobacteriota bacterium]